MQGKKLLQTQNAMKTILNEMRPEDHLTLITFSDDVITWSLNGQESTLRYLAPIVTCPNRKCPLLSKPILDFVNVIRTHVKLCNFRLRTELKYSQIFVKIS